MLVQLLFGVAPKGHLNVLIITLCNALNIPGDLHNVLAHSSLLWIHQSHHPLSSLDDSFVVISLLLHKRLFERHFPCRGIGFMFVESNFSALFAHKLLLKVAFQSCICVLNGIASNSLGSRACGQSRKDEC
jgi:hypothetical protein